MRSTRRQPWRRRPSAAIASARRLHVRHGQVGFFRGQSHALCDAATSGQLREEAVAAARRLVDALGPRLADVEAIVVAENIRASERVAASRAARRRQDPRDRYASRWNLPGVTGVTTASGGGLDLMPGCATVTDHAQDLFAGPPPVDGSTAWTRHATSFFQGNRFLAGALVSRVLEAVSASPAQAVADCYAGVGLFAVTIAATGAQVVAVEGDPSSGADLAANAKPFGESCAWWPHRSRRRLLRRHRPISTSRLCRSAANGDDARRRARIGGLARREARVRVVRSADARA